jgi:predicted RNA-binding protein associated with RNAse of E/G family
VLSLIISFVKDLIKGIKQNNNHNQYYIYIKNKNKKLTTTEGDFFFVVVVEPVFTHILATNKN